MPVLIDLNVILDVLMDRAPHAEASAQVLGLAETGRVQALCCAASFSTLHYLLNKHSDAATSRRHLLAVRRILPIAAVDGPVIDAALQLGWRDFEDAIVHESARLAGAEAIVTRDATGFANAPLRIYTPTEFLAALGHG